MKTCVHEIVTILLSEYFEYVEVFSAFRACISLYGHEQALRVPAG
jgi:hypothetical protein